MKIKLTILYVLLVGLVITLLVSINKPVKDSNELNNAFFCGTKSSIKSEEAKYGKKIFNANCAACHKIDKNMTGPALRGVVKLYKENKLSLTSFLRGKRDTLLYKEEFLEYNCMSFPELSNEDIYDLTMFLEEISN